MTLQFPRLYSGSGDPSEARTGSTGRHGLDMDADTMRALGYRIVDEIVAHHESIPERPVSHSADRSNLEAALSERILPEYLEDTRREDAAIN